MLKNKTKEQLLELLYQANNENFSLQLCNDKQSEILKSIAILYRKKGFFARILNFFAMPWKILQLLKKHNEYFYNLSNTLETMELNKEQCIKAKKDILAFENQTISTSEYSEIVISLLGLPKNCGHCDDVQGRLHNDFQKRVIRECSEKYPELLPTPPTLLSGQFQGSTYFGWMQTYTFKELRELLSRMKTAAYNTKQGGRLEQAKVMLDDCERLKEFIQLRKMGLPTGEETTGEVALDVEIKVHEVFNELTDNEKKALGFIEDSLETEIVINESGKQIESFINELKEDFAEIDKETTEAAKEKKVYTDEEAYALKNSGMTLAELGVYYGVDTSTIQRKLKRYGEILASKRPKDETSNE